MYISLNPNEFKYLKHMKRLFARFSTLHSKQVDKVRKYLYLHQENRCAICGVKEDDCGKKLALDHCHKTDRVRGLLCTNCNILLGYAKDEKRLLVNAIKYLESPNGLSKKLKELYKSHI